MDEIRTALSDVDGERGLLTICGRSLDDLVGRLSFEEMLGVLWHEPAALAAGRVAAWEQLQSWWPAILAPAPMDGLKIGLSLLSNPTPSLLTGAMAVMGAAMARPQQTPVAPDPGLGHAHDLLRMMGLDASRVAGLDGYMVTVAEHGMNASTYTARVVASTRAGVRSAVVAALSALEGPLHGGAPGPVLDMLDAIGSSEHARQWLETELAAGRRLMGFGHRVYRVRDPRADALKSLLQQYSSQRLALAEKVEVEARRVLSQRHPERRLDTNVEYYTALLLEALGIPRTLFTVVFACARVGGWCAHVEEQEREGHLIRPSSTYTGPISTKQCL